MSCSRPRAASEGAREVRAHDIDGRSEPHGRVDPPCPRARILLRPSDVMEERIAVIGLGYVGLPVALAFAKKFRSTVGFDVSSARVASLQRGVDATREVDGSELSSTSLQITTDP